eukprot:scaffold232397_cov43-Tisochrysis_lutea.AAC.1
MLAAGGMRELRVGAPSDVEPTALGALAHVLVKPAFIEDERRGCSVSSRSIVERVREGEAEK